MDSDFAQLAHVGSLRTLSLWGTPLTGPATARLSSATQLTSLTFGTEVTDAHVKVSEGLSVELRSTDPGLELRLSLGLAPPRSPRVFPGSTPAQHRESDGGKTMSL